jgi:serine/threonine-protein kinase RsbW
MAVDHEPTMVAKTFPAQLASVAQGIAFVVERAIAAGAPPKRVAEIELVAEEALVNICHYAYRNRAGDVEVRCTWDGSHRFRVEFIDTGDPFNILTLPPPDLTADIDQRSVGGLGALFIRSLVDRATYCRQDNRNILHLVVELPG